jgi:hypothetical protein
VFGAFPVLAGRALEAYPFLRVIVDRQTPGATLVGSMDEVRSAVKGPRGPIRT